MKKSARYTALALVALTSALLLGACGGNKQATTTSSTAKTSQSSKMTKSSTKTKAKSENKTKASSSEEMKADSSASQEAQAAKQAEPAKEEKAPAQKEEKAISPEPVANDYSQFAGSWVNSEGTSVEITADGKVTMSSSLGTGQYQMNSQTQSDGSVAAYMNAVGGGDGASIIITPAGKTNENTGADGSRDTLFIGQSFGSSQDLYYRK